MSIEVSLQTCKLPDALAVSVTANIDDWRSGDKVRRLWQHDASLWTGTDEAIWLGWLDITGDQMAHSEKLRAAVADVKKEGFSDILLLGMGGSSLSPEVLRATFAKVAGFPELHVLQSTDPAQVKAFENRVNLAKTLFIVSSKSGTTLEPNIFKQYFFERVKQTISGMKRAAAFSRTQEMVEACGSGVPADQNPGALLGIRLRMPKSQPWSRLGILWFAFPSVTFTI